MKEKKPTSTEKRTTKKQHRVISRLLGCITNVNVMVGKNGLKTTENASCVF